MAKQQDPKKKAEEIKDSFDDVTLSIKDLEKELSKVFNTKKLDNFVKSLTAGFEDSIDYSDKIQDKMTGISKSVTALSKEFGSLRGELNSFSKEVSNIKIPNLNIISNINEVDISSLQESIKNLPDINLNASISNIDTSKLENIDLAMLEDIQANIKFNVQPIDLPNIEDINSVINYTNQIPDAPKVEDIQANIKFNVQDLLNFNDIPLNAKLNKIDLSELDKMPISELMAEIGLVDTSLLDKTIDKYNPIILSSIIDTPDVTELNNIAKNIPSIQLQSEIDTSNATAAIQEQANATNEVTINTIASTKALDKMQKKHDDIIKKINEGGKASKSELKFLTDYNKNLTSTVQASTNAQNAYRNSIIGTTDGQKKFNEITKQLATYDGPRFKAAGLITKELSNQLSQNKFIEQSKSRLNELDGASTGYSKLLTLEGKSQTQISTELLKKQQEIENALQQKVGITSKLNELNKEAENKQNQINILSEMGLGNSETVKNLQNEINDSLQTRNNLTSQSYTLEDKLANLLQDQANLDFSARVASSTELTSIFEELNKLTSNQISEQGSLAAKMNEVEQSAYNVGTAQFRQVDLSDEINDRLVEQRSLESARQQILNNNIGLTEKEVEKALSLVDANIQANNAQLKQYEALQKSSDAYAIVQEKAEGLRDSMMTPVDKLFGIVPSGLSKMLGLDSIQAEMKDKLFKSIADGFMSAGGGARGFFAAATAGASTLMASLAPILPLLLAIAAVVGIVKLFTDADKQVSQLAKDLNISYTEAGKLQNTATDIASEMNVVGMNTAEVEKQMVELQKATGLNVGLLASQNEQAKALLATSTMLTTQYGLSAEETMALNSAAAIGGGTLDKMALAAEKFGEDGLIPAGEIMKDIAKTSKTVLMNFKGDYIALARATKQAKLMGTTLDKMNAAGESLLNIESSIAAQNKARMMLGRNINLDAARYYALQGDTEGLMQEMVKAAGSVEDYDKMSVLQKKALAEAMGMQVSDLDEMMMKQKELNTLGIDANKLQEIMTKAKDGTIDLEKELLGMKDEDARKLLKQKVAEQERAGTQEKLADTMQKVMDLLYKIVAPLLPMVDAFIDSLGDGKGVLTSMSGAFEGVGAILKDTFSVVTAIFGAIMQLAKPVVDIVKSLLNSFGQLSSSGDGFGKTIKDIGAIILTYLYAPWLAVYEFVAGFVQGIMPIVDSILGLVSPILDLFSGASKEGGGLMDILMGIGGIIQTIGKYVGYAFSAILTPIGSLIKGVLEPLKGIFGKIIDAFSPISDLFKSSGKEGKSFMDTLKPVLDIFQKIGNVIGGVIAVNFDIVINAIKNTMKILAGLWDIISGIFTLDGERIVKGLESIGGAIIDTLTYPFKKAYEWIMGLFGGNSPSKLGESIVLGISSVAESIFDFITWPFKKAWDFIGNLFGMGDLGSSIIDGVKNVFSEVGSMIMKYIKSAWDVVSGIFTFDGNKILDGLKGIGNAIISMITYPFEKAMNLIGKLFGIKELGSSIIKGLKSFGKKVIDIIKMPFMKAVDWISETFGGIGGKLIDGISNVASKIWDFITSPFKKAWEWITGLFGGTGKKIIEGISNLATDVYSSVTGAFKSGYDWVINTFSNVGQKIADGISSVGGSIVNSITAPFTEAWDSISSWLGFSPSELGNGIVKGISSVSGDVESNLTKPFDSAEQQVSKSASAMADSVSNISGDASMSIKGVSDKDLGKIQKMSDSASSGLSSMVSSLFGSDEEQVSTEAPKQAGTATSVTPIMQPVAAVNTQPAAGNQPGATANTQNNNAKLEGLVRELIAKVEQPVIIKLGEKTVAEMQSAISFRKSYGANVNGYRS